VSELSLQNPGDLQSELLLVVRERNEDSASPIDMCQTACPSVSVWAERSEWVIAEDAN
jgi:hypothetical protein